MKLAELESRWITDKEQRVIGIVFRCPCCHLKENERDRIWLTCYWTPQGDPWSQFDRLIELFPDFSEDTLVVPVRAGFAWARSGETFENLTITPSLDASASGNWHGFITQGEIR